MPMDGPGHRVVTGLPVWQANVYQKVQDYEVCPTRESFEDYLHNGYIFIRDVPATLAELLNKGVRMFDVAYENDEGSES